MPRARVSPDPWALVWGQPWIDSDRLAAAIEADLVRQGAADFRTRLLARDAAVALRSFWGRHRFQGWLEASPARDQLRGILTEDLGEPGFANIRRRLVTPLGLTQLRQILTLLGQRVNDPQEISIAGSIPTLVKGLTARPTTDIDLVNEVPLVLRRQRALLKKIEDEFGLTLGHVQSHYLPAGWEQRRQSLGDFGGLRVFLVDVIDIFVSKLSSKLEKHLQDLRVLALKLDKDKVHQRLVTSGGAFLEDAYLRPQIDANWEFVYQEALVIDARSERKARRKPENPRE